MRNLEGWGKADAGIALMFGTLVDRWDLCRSRGCGSNRLQRMSSASAVRFMAQSKHNYCLLSYHHCVGVANMVV